MRKLWNSLRIIEDAEKLFPPDTKPRKITTSQFDLFYMEIFIDGIRYLPEREASVSATQFNVLITLARKRKRETLDEASGNMGIAKSQLWSLEKGETEPKLKMLQKLIKYYGLSFEQIDDA